MQKISGTHLIVDAYVKNAATLQQDNVLKLFDSLVEALNMCYLQRPIAVEVPLDPTKLSTDEDEGGCSYYCMITTSHISAHTWKLRNAVMLDVFSCRPFDVDTAIAIIDRSLEFTHSKTVVVAREDPAMFEGHKQHSSTLSYARL